MATVSEQAIATLAEVKAFLIEHDASDALAEEVFTDGGQYDEEGVSLIESSSKRLKDYLHRDLTVSEWTPLFAQEDWELVKRTPDLNYPYRLKIYRVPDWPVLKVNEDVKVQGKRRIFAQSRGLNKIQLWAGYRREGQTSADLGVDSELSDSEIPTYPENLVQVVKKIAVFEANQQVKGLIGVQSETQMMGEFSTEVRTTETDRNYVNRALQSAQSHRSI